MHTARANRSTTSPRLHPTPRARPLRDPASRAATRAHTCFDGFVITYEARPDTDAFLDRIHAAAADPAVDPRALFALVYGEDNPILAPRPEAGRGFLTRESLADPLYVVLQDLLFRKRVAWAARLDRAPSS